MPDLCAGHEHPCLCPVQTLKKHPNIERVDCRIFFCPFLIKDCSQLPMAQSCSKNLEPLLIFYRRHIMALHHRRQKGKRILVMGRCYVDGSPPDDCIVYIVSIEGKILSLLDLKHEHDIPIPEPLLCICLVHLLSFHELQLAAFNNHCP
jgi:hypothetical protein